jgi:hypothetical protein
MKAMTNQPLNSKKAAYKHTYKQNVKLFHIWSDLVNFINILHFAVGI